MSKKAVILLVVSGLFSLAIGLSNVFVNVFLWKKSNDFVMVAQYNLMHYVFIPIVFVFAGWISKKKNGIWPLRLGITFYIAFFICILLLKDDVIKFIYPLGMLFGIAAGFYWLAFYVLSFDFTSTNNRDTFNGLNGFVIGIPNALAPFIAAYIIEKNNNSLGYSMVFAISLGLFIILILISFLLRSEHYGKRFEFRKVISKNSAKWGEMRKAIAAWGLRDMVIIFTVTILIFKATGSEWAVGSLSLYAYLISSASHIIEQKIVKPKRRMISMQIGAAFMFIAVLGLAVKIDYGTLLFFIIVDAAFMPFFFVPVSSASFNIISQNHEEGLREEYIINKDIMLNGGRIISTLILIGLLTFVKSDAVLNYFLLFIGASQLVSIYFLRRIDIWQK